MRLGQWVVVIGALVALVGIGSIAKADDPIGRISFGGSAGWSSLAMGDVNDRITGDGRDFLDRKDWEPLDRLSHGWTFWSDLRVPLPLGEMSVNVPFINKRLPLEFSLAGGIGTCSGSTTGPDTNELLEVEAQQNYYHARLLYTVPWRPAEDSRLFLAGGPMIITTQELTARHTHRDASGGGSGRVIERMEEVTYLGDGLGWTLGLALEYMVHDYITLAVDFAYRWANIEYAAWNPFDNITVSDTDPIDLGGDQGTTLDRLYREDSFVFYSFLDWETTERAERALFQGEVHEWGPHREMLNPVALEDLNIDMSGIQIHLGFRFYFL
jgi:hypothetical protein